MVRSHLRDGKFVNQYQKKYKLGSQHELTVPDKLFEEIGVPKRPVLADIAHLFDKHKLQFKSPEQMKSAIEWVLRKPEFIFNTAENPMVLNYIRQHYKQPFEHPLVAVSFFHRKGSKGYIVRTVHLITNDQFSGKVTGAMERHLRDKDLHLFEFGSSLHKSMPENTEYVLVREMIQPERKP
jgi:hypothetical protein